MDASIKEVSFYKYCDSCKHSEKKGYEHPCTDCLDESARYGTEKPSYWEENDKKSQ